MNVLHIAVDKMNYELTKLLLKNGANPNVFTKSSVASIRALGKVISQTDGQSDSDKYIAFVELLLSYGADPIKIYRGASSRTAIELAKYKGQFYGASATDAIVEALNSAISTR